MAKKTIKQQYVSIHTPTKGVTCAALLSCLILVVSIHTPTKGVTFEGRFGHGFFDVSIHTPTKGVTKIYFYCSTTDTFQSTHPRRV